MELVTCPKCSSADIQDMDAVNYRCLECGLLFEEELPDEIPV